MKLLKKTNKDKDYMFFKMRLAINTNLQLCKQYNIDNTCACSSNGLLTLFIKHSIIYHPHGLVV